MNNKDLEELGEYADADETEVGEAISAALNLYHRSDYLTKQLVAELEEFLETTLKDFKEQFEIVETTETIKRNVKVLVQK